MRRAIPLLLVCVLTACAVTLETPRQKLYAAEAAFQQAAGMVLSAVDSGQIEPGSAAAQVAARTLGAARVSLDAAWAAIREGNDDLALALVSAALVAVQDVRRSLP